MRDSYYELKVSVEDEYRNLFLDFLSEVFEDAIEEDKDGFVIRSSSSLEEIEWGVLEFKKELSTIFKKEIKLTTDMQELENQNWIEKYKKSIEPIKIGNLYIHPSWYENIDEYINIIIDPALAFGSGHHESTNSCIELLLKHLQKNQIILDVGCGSGILGIVASKLGALNVDICDSDQLAVEESKKNFELNSVNINKYWIGSVNLAEDIKYDFVIANIIADILKLLSKDLNRVLKSGGFLLLSGILEKYESSLLEKFANFIIVDRVAKGEWVTLLLQKN